MTTENINEQLLMPEYGRNIQRMVEYALTLQDKEERTRCVQAIMHTMENLFPYLKNEESRHKMYDHLALMSDFQLDIDSPYPRPNPEELRYRPEKLPYNTTTPVHYRHYGRILEEAISKAVEETDPEKKKQLILRIVSRMKQNFLIWNKDNVDKEHLAADITTLSGGKLNCDFPEFEEIAGKLPIKQKQQIPQQKKNKKRKKKDNTPRAI